MCEAMRELMREELQKSYEEGVRIGKEYVNSCLSQLYDILIPQNRQDDFIRSAIDLEYRDKLCKEYGIKLLEELRIA